MVRTVFPRRQVRSISLAAATFVFFSSAVVQNASASGNAARGAAVFLRCAACHSASKDGGNGLGPNLWGVMGRRAAALPDFPYSSALRRSKIVWTGINLSRWLAGPQKFIPGTRMAFAGLSSQKDIDDVIAYLNTRK
jgi:cytochrome c